MLILDVDEGLLSVKHETWQSRLCLRITENRELSML